MLQYHQISDESRQTNSIIVERKSNYIIGAHTGQIPIILSQRSQCPPRPHPLFSGLLANSFSFSISTTLNARLIHFLYFFSFYHCHLPNWFIQI